jgi:hypothetical protein
MKSIKVYLSESLFDALEKRSLESGQSKSALCERLLDQAVYEKKISEDLRAIRAEIQVVLRTVAMVSLKQNSGITDAEKEEINQKIEPLVEKLLDRARKLEGDL